MGQAMIGALKFEDVQPVPGDHGPSLIGLNIVILCRHGSAHGSSLSIGRSPRVSGCLACQPVLETEEITVWAKRTKIGMRRSSAYQDCWPLALREVASAHEGLNSAMTFTVSTYTQQLHSQN